MYIYNANADNHTAGIPDSQIKTQIIPDRRIFLPFPPGPLGDNVSSQTTEPG